MFDRVLRKLDGSIYVFVRLYRWEKKEESSDGFLEIFPLRENENSIKKRIFQGFFFLLTCLLCIYKWFFISIRICPTEHSTEAKRNTERQAQQQRQ